jgi:hypothetical protein
MAKILPFLNSRRWQSSDGKGFASTVPILYFIENG